MQLILFFIVLDLFCCRTIYLSANSLNLCRSIYLSNFYKSLISIARASLNRWTKVRRTYCKWLVVSKMRFRKANAEKITIHSLLRMGENPGFKYCPIDATKYLFLCACLFVCVREREREIDRERDFICVCV